MKKLVAYCMALCLLLSAMPAFASAPEGIGSGHWAYEDAVFLADTGILRTDVAFDADAAAARGTFLRMLMDVSVAPGIGGLKDGLFQSASSITRYEAVGLMVRALKYSGGGEDGFTFADDTGRRHQEAYAAHNAGIIKGYPDGTFRGLNPLTNAEMAAVMRRIYEKTQQPEGNGLEIERKFVVDADNIPYDLSKADRFDIIQTYISFSPEIRVRKINGSYYSFAIKMPKDTAGLVRQELEFDIKADEYERLYAKREAESIYKMRYQFYVGDEYVAVDIYSGALQGLAVAEIEFDNEQQADAFVPYDWFIKDVTADKRYKNANLAKDGMPQD